MKSKVQMGPECHKVFGMFEEPEQMELEGVLMKDRDLQKANRELARLQQQGKFIQYAKAAAFRDRIAHTIMNKFNDQLIQEEMDNGCRRDDLSEEDMKKFVAHVELIHVLGDMIDIEIRSFMPELEKAKMCVPIVEAIHEHTKALNALTRHVAARKRNRYGEWYLDQYDNIQEDFTKMLKNKIWKLLTKVTEGVHVPKPGK